MFNCWGRLKCKIIHICFEVFLIRVSGGKGRGVWRKVRANLTFEPLHPLIIKESTQAETHVNMNTNACVFFLVLLFYLTIFSFTVYLFSWFFHQISVLLLLLLFPLSSFNLSSFSLKFILYFPFYVYLSSFLPLFFFPHIYLNPSSLLQSLLFFPSHFSRFQNFALQRYPSSSLHSLFKYLLLPVPSS